MQSSIQIEEIAAEWLARRARGDWSEADQVELARWLDESTANRVAFVRLDAAWQETARLRALQAGGGGLPAPGQWGIGRFVPRTGGEEDLTSDSSLKPTGPLMHWAIAATLLLATSLFATWFALTPHAESYSTVVGGLQTVPLPDGSHVTLNTDTDIKVAMTATERRVELERGEAFFEVAKDAKRPFVVKAGDRRVVVIGTKFSVLRLGDDFRVMVVEGEVRVERENGKSAPVARLEPGHIARAKETEMLIQEKPITQVEEFLSWRSGFLVFHDTMLSDAVSEFNRYNTRKIVIADPSIALTRIGGHFRSTNAEAFLRLLEEGFPLVVDRQPDRVVLTASRTS